MRDKVKERVFKMLKNGIAFRPEERTWLLNELKQLDRLKSASRSVDKELARVELMLAAGHVKEAQTHIAQMHSMLS